MMRNFDFHFSAIQLPQLLLSWEKTIPKQLLLKHLNKIIPLLHANKKHNFFLLIFPHTSKMGPESVVLGEPTITSYCYRTSMPLEQVILLTMPAQELQTIGCTV